MSDDYFGKNEKKWKWQTFKSTKGFPIPSRLLDWVIGQEKALEETKLCIDEWINKLLWLKKKNWWKDFESPDKPKPPPKEWLPSGPFLLLLGDAGTGKSLIGRALSTYMTDLYKKHNIQLTDVICWKNPIIPSEPKISIHPTPEGKKLVEKIKKKIARKGKLTRIFLKAITPILIGFGGLILFIGAYWWLYPWFANSIMFGVPVRTLYPDFFTYSVNIFGNLLPFFLSGSSMILSAVFIRFFGRMFGATKGIGGAESTDAPKLIVDNSLGVAPFVDATGHGSAQLFGSIAWDPYQTGDLGTPEHQRVTAGDVHRAHLGVLYIDEIKNLKGHEATTLLTVLEDGQLPIALRSQWHGGDTAAMAVSTEPVPAMVFLIAAGNLDSIPQIHPALMDRIRGYGKIVYMNNDMPNTVENRRKYVQFIAQEVKRFNLLPFSREACKAVIEEARRQSGRNDRLTCKFRPMISILKTASVLAKNEGLNIVNAKHVNEAIREHCKSIHRQILERQAEHNKDYRIVNPKAKPKIGQIHGLVVYKLGGERMGWVCPVRASVKKAKKGKGYFYVTGVKSGEDTWVQNSIKKVETVISQLYGFKLSDRYTHIDFAQTIGIDGPSAGVTMVLALISNIEKKKIRQDVAVTGEINIGVDGKIIITPVGGLHEKITAAEELGFKKVLIPKLNYEKDIKPKDYKIEVIPCETLEDYKKVVFVD